MTDEAPYAPDHRETDLERVAAVSDRGKRHADNQDACTIEIAGDRAIAVVCDGVSTSWRPDLAAGAAVEAAIATLRQLLGQDEWNTETLSGTIKEAAAGAEEAVAAVVTPAETATATTIVIAAVGPGHAAVGNIGDSRAYWIDGGTAAHRAVTVDDSWAEQAIRDGIPADEAYSSPHAHVITRCLRSDLAAVGPPRISILEISGPGTLLVCTDGLWNYAQDPDDLARLAAISPGEPPIDVARRLVAAALDAGGIDNVTVAVIPAGPGGVAAAGTDPDDPTLRLPGA